jgi:amino acid adenylation domain-containing protein
MQDVNVEGFQLSPQQRHLWSFARQVSDSASPYSARAVVRIRGDVDLSALRSALDRLPARHEILRTTFFAPEEIAMPLQVIAPSSERVSGVVLTLTTSSTTDHLLTIEAPALLCDAQGLHALVADLAATYEAHVAAVPRPYEGIQYADAAIWLNDMLESSEAEAGRQFWQEKDVRQALDARLPFERLTGDTAPFDPKRVPVRLDAVSVADAHRFCADAGTTIELFSLTCWQTLIQRFLDSDQVVVGYVASGRGYAELYQAVGLFARCLPLAGDLPREMPFDEALTKLNRMVRESQQWCECFDWRNLPQPSRQTTPFIPITFEFRERPGRYLAAGVEFEIEDACSMIDRFQLRLSCEGRSDDVSGIRIDYDASAFSEQDIRRLAGEFETLFAAAAREPHLAVDALPLVRQLDADPIIRTLGHAVRPIPSVDFLHRRFEEHAARFPNQTAVVFEEERLTYGELNHRSNQLAHHLRALGVGPDVIVGLCVDRSVEMTVGILGILKAGGAYLPLDPQLPAARLALILAESAASIVVSRASLAGLVTGTEHVVHLDGDRDALDRQPDTNPVSEIIPEHLAYVMFTSGSTGKPKGVAVEHRQLSSYVDSIVRRLDMPAGATFATVTTFAADLGNTCIYPALTSGGCLHVVSEEVAADPHAFGEYVRRHPIDVLKIVPSHLKALMTSSQPVNVLPRQRLVLGGEACPWDLVADVRRLAPSCVIFNHYGPTETTVGATMYRVTETSSPAASATVPIGGPLDHAQVYVLDRYFRPVPVWGVGELYIGGAGVARGYLADAELTAARFLHDPWGHGSNARMYRTGDRVRVLPTGTLEFLGRLDSQVKIRGFRVELGEIEAAVRQHPDVNHAHVVTYDNNGPRVAAFVVYRPASRSGANELRDFMKGQGLPDYMIPSSFVALDALPLTSNGKPDRQRLLACLDAPAALPQNEEPLTGWEAIVAGIWQELLGVDSIQPSDNFYDLGGHSLLAIQVVSALERRARVQISPRDLVFHTLRQFSALCMSKSVSEDGTQTSHV